VGELIRQADLPFLHGLNLLDLLLYISRPVYSLFSLLTACIH